MSSTQTTTPSQSAERAPANEAAIARARTPTTAAAVSRTDRARAPGVRTLADAARAASRQADSEKPTNRAAPASQSPMSIVVSRSVSGQDGTRASTRPQPVYVPMAPNTAGARA